ncbi:GSCOCG00006822001-RA-CDS [Cotesia congregata]|nr:GSCOCG00006822001-RA-CDS [Cotesia congregata]
MLQPAIVDLQIKIIFNYFTLRTQFTRMTNEVTIVDINNINNKIKTMQWIWSKDK